MENKPEILIARKREIRSQREVRKTEPSSEVII